jgi:prophage DNA circulation protein
VKYTPAATTNSLVLAYRLYGTVSREPDIVTRNAIRNPAFVAAGTELEVLSHAE